MRILVYGYGNPGRQDDGLGEALVSKLEQAPIPDVDTDSNYQLNIEDAHTIAEYDVAIFVDATLSEGETFSFKEIEPSLEITFTTHAMAPDSILALCGDISEKVPHAYILAIKGYEWEFMEKMSDEANKNLEAAWSFLEPLLHRKSLEAFKAAASGAKSTSDLQ